jgi:hypothetical protein
VVDIDAAIGFVVAKGDPVERARLSWLRTGAAPHPDVLAKAELGQAPEGGWPAVWGQAPSVDATCFHLAELDDLGALGRPAARRALDWLAGRQREDGTWEEDESLAAEAPVWARPGDPEARLYLTANAGYWLTVAGAYPDAVAGAARAVSASLREDGTWPSFLVTGWLGAAVLYRQQAYYDSARIQLVLSDRLSGMSPADLAWMAASLRRVGVPDGDWLPVATRRLLAQTQRSDGGWPSDDGPAFDVHVTLTAIRACR